VTVFANTNTCNPLLGLKDEMKTALIDDVNSFQKSIEISIFKQDFLP